MSSCATGFGRLSRLRAVSDGTLPAVAFVKPDGLLDGHPASSKVDLFEGMLQKILDTLDGNPELKAETAEIEKEKTEARERTAEDEKQLAEWNAKRDKLRGGVSPDVLRHYERVLKFRGSGLSEVRDQKCMTCRVMLRPQR